MTQPQTQTDTVLSDTQNAANNAVSEHPFTRVFVKIRVNANIGVHLASLGIPLNVRTEDVEGAIIAKHAEEAIAAGRAPFRYDRRDGAGNLRADSGVKVFGEKGLSNVVLTTIVSDLKGAGYILNGVKLLLKDGDTMYTLQLLFLPALPGIAEAVVTQEIEEDVRKGLATVWQFVHVYANPDGSSTVNAGHMLRDFRGNTTPLALADITAALDALPE